ncbi:MAG: MerR family transcriptional regulator, partial [Caldimicrobium sp.]
MKKEKNKEYEPLFIPLKEVCKILSIKPHVLDYWIKRIPEVKPVKIGKRKFFKKEQMELLTQIKKLLEEGYSLEGIRRKL